MSQAEPDKQMQEMNRRLEMLERENERLRSKLEPLIGPENPCFNPTIFQTVLARNLVVIMAPLFIVPLIAFLPRFLGPIGAWHIGRVPLFDFAGMNSRILPGMGFGIISVGGVAFGAIAMGGMGVGLIAVGGAAAGLIAFGGGSVGVIAIGGGACGYIAIGGNAYGTYSLGQRAHGKFALGLNRQDQEAVDFFVRFVPGLRKAVTNPMPVIMIEKPDEPTTASPAQKS